MTHKHYNVRPGDTLSGIAGWAGVPYPDLLSINPQIENPNLIFSGQTILVPEAIHRPEILVAAARDVFPGDEPEWYKIAMREIGERETRSNPRIIEYLATTTLSPANKATDATAWCGAFVNWCLKTAGIKGLNSAWALDWASFETEAESPRLGDIVVFSRKSATESGGHVGFFVQDLGSKVKVLGGNQGDAVSYGEYPKNGKKGPYDYKLKSFRRP